MENYFHHKPLFIYIISYRHNRHENISLHPWYGMAIGKDSIVDDDGWGMKVSR